MQLLKNMTPRERVILAITVCVGLGTLLYLGLLEGMIQKYGEISENLATAHSLYEAQKELLKEGERVDREYEEFYAMIPSGREGKRPERVFTEEIQNLCSSREIPLPVVGQKKTLKIDGAPGFSYLILPIPSPGISAPLPRLYDLLADLQSRGFMIRSLQIDATGQDESAQMSLDVAQIVRDEEIEAKTAPKK
ncbi:hypothetical protein JW916_15360 [Candidatus Sumerlaeota bacterium]|nr:hypothetical protein [Candidatus Sumerlaeota bacterium]